MLTAIKSIEYSGAIPIWNAGAVVGHDQRRATIQSGDTDIHLAAIRGVANRVIHQIAQDDTQAVYIATDKLLHGRCIRPEVDTLALSDQVKIADNFLRQSLQIDLFGVHDRAACLMPGESQQLPHQARGAIESVMQLQECQSTLFLAGCVLGQLQLQFQCRQRCAQFVRSIRYECPLHDHGMIELLEQVVQGNDHGRDFRRQAVFSQRLE